MYQMFVGSTAIEQHGLQAIVHILDDPRPPGAVMKLNALMLEIPQKTGGAAIC
jgi:hypothetical protein